MHTQDSPIKVLVVDDSAVARGVISRILNSHPGMTVVGFCKDGTEVVAAVEKLRPDVITLDLEMPLLKGTTILKHVLSKHPTPVIMVSSMTRAGAQITLDCLAMGALDFVLKPGATQPTASLTDYCSELSSKVLAAGLAARSKSAHQAGELQALVKIKSGVWAKGVSPGATKLKTQKDAILAIGASTGGPSAVAALLNRLPSDVPPIVVAIHMPVPFTTLYADRLSRSIKAIRVKLVEQGELLSEGTAYIAPGDQHFRVVRTENQSVYARLEKPTAQDLYKPSIDKLFNSVADAYGDAALACVLTGMGSDGALGAGEIFKCGGVVLSQDEKSSAIYGMPKVVFDNGHSHRQLSLQDFPIEIYQLFQQRLSK
jgi:two-component system, chemotaxis family, protein-glutamate methylesterase/glutaminase